MSSSGKRRARGERGESSYSHPGAGHRHARLQQVLREELASILRDEVSDPSLSVVRILAVRLSVDYRNARIYFAIAPAGAHPPPQKADIERALQRACPFLRSRLADAVDIKRVPELRFIFDAQAAGDSFGEEDGSPSPSAHRNGGMPG